MEYHAEDLTQLGGALLLVSFGVVVFTTTAVAGTLAFVGTVKYLLDKCVPD